MMHSVGACEGEKVLPGAQEQNIIRGTTGHVLFSPTSGQKPLSQSAAGSDSLCEEKNF